MTELKRCPFCGKEQSETNFFSCDGYPQACGCWEMTTTGEEAEQVWNTRPIEDELEARIAQLTAENERLCSLLHDINSQLEIATDLGSKRWQALNDIYLNGEKHNANWCKRKAQEGLGIR